MSREKKLNFSHRNYQLLDDGSCDGKLTMIIINPKDSAGRTFLKEIEEYGQCFQARAVHATIDNECHQIHNTIFWEFGCDGVDHILTYCEIIDDIKKDNNDLESYTEQVYNFFGFMSIKNHFKCQIWIIQDQ
jgi:hypothetical protein